LFSPTTQQSQIPSFKSQKGFPSALSVRASIPSSAGQNKANFLSYKINILSCHTQLFVEGEFLRDYHNTSLLIVLGPLPFWPFLSGYRCINSLIPSTGFLENLLRIFFFFFDSIYDRICQPTSLFSSFYCERPPFLYLIDSL